LACGIAGAVIVSARRIGSAGAATGVGNKPRAAKPSSLSWWAGVLWFGFIEVGFQLTRASAAVVGCSNNGVNNRLWVGYSRGGYNRRAGWGVSLSRGGSSSVGWGSRFGRSGVVVVVGLFGRISGGGYNTCSGLF
jgi:hypothetical protein